MISANDRNLRIHLTNEFYNLDLKQKIEKCELHEKEKELWNIIEKNRINYLTDYFRKLTKVTDVMDDPEKSFQYIYSFVKDTPSLPYLKSILQCFAITLQSQEYRLTYFSIFEKLISELILNQSNNLSEDCKLIQSDIDNLLEQFNYKVKYEQTKEINQVLNQKIKIIQDEQIDLYVKYKEKDISDVKKKEDLIPIKPENPVSEVKEDIKTQNISLDKNNVTKVSEKVLGEAETVQNKTQDLPKIQKNEISPPLASVKPKLPGAPKPPPSLKPTPKAPPIKSPPGVPNISPPSKPGVISSAKKTPLVGAGRRLGGANHLGQKKEHKPEFPVKKMPWSKLPNRKITKDSFWAKTEEEKFYNECLFESVVESFKQPLSESKNQPNLEKLENRPMFNVIDSKLGQNLGILLNSNKLKPKDAAQAIRNADKNTRVEFLENLYKQLPDDEVLAKFSEYDMPENEWISSEFFCKLLSEIPDVKFKLQDLIFIRKFPEMYGSLKPSLQVIKCAIDEILNSTNFKKILELVLLIGNILNSGSALGKAYGFDFNILPKVLIISNLFKNEIKLKNITSKTGKETMIYFIVSILQDEHKNILLFVYELENIPPASKISFESSKTDLSIISISYERLKANLKKTQEDRKSDIFYIESKEFLNKSEKKIKKLNVLSEVIQEKFLELCKTFSIDKNKENTQNIMRNIADFLNDFQIAQNEFESNKKKIERQKKMSSIKNANEKPTLLDSSAIYGTQQENLMNDLIKSLNSRVK
ncbi:MAG: Protein diaphanous 2 [Paramarteilia canceri]